jgi:hypothetical protein
MVTEGGVACAGGRGRKFLVGDGDTFAGAVRRCLSPAISPVSFSRPLPTRRLSTEGSTLSCCPKTALLASPLLAPTVFTVGFGEIALGGGLLWGFELAICSKCDRREDTGFCRERH